MRALIDLVENAQPDLVELAVQHYGLTRNPRECGYLLPDGRMLDFSGRHHDGYFVRQGDYNVPKKGADYNANNRFVDHRELGDGWVEAEGTDSIWEFMQKTGAIRVAPGNGFDILVKPTKRQIAYMCMMAEFYGDEIYVDVVTEPQHSQSFIDMTPAALIKFLRKAGMA